MTNNTPSALVDPVRWTSMFDLGRAIRAAEDAGDLDRADALWAEAHALSNP